MFRCCSVCVTMEDDKEGYYFKGTCDVISVIMETHKVHKSVL